MLVQQMTHITMATRNTEMGATTTKNPKPSLILFALNTDRLVVCEWVRDIDSFEVVA
jgi:hypothetical protein